MVIVSKLYSNFIDIDETSIDETSIDDKTALKLFQEQNIDKSKPDEFDTKLLNRVILRFHKPANIVVLTTTYDNNFGTAYGVNNIFTALAFDNSQTTVAMGINVGSTGSG